MPNPINSNLPSAVGFYDNEHGECRPVDASTPRASSRSEAASAGDPRANQSPAVDQLVKGATRNCAREIVEAGAACVAAVGGALTATTVVGGVVAIAAGAACGAKIASAETTCRD